jgi:hypothetical protein
MLYCPLPTAHVLLTLDPLKQLHRNERAAKQHKTKYHLALATIIMSLIPTNKASVAYDVDYVLCPDVESQARSSVSGNCTISTSESASKIRKELELERIPREWFIVLMTLLLLQLAVSVVLIMNLLMNLPAKKKHSPVQLVFFQEYLQLVSLCF